MRIDSAGVSAYQINQAKATDVPRIQPRETAEAREPDRDTDDTRVAATRQQWNWDQTKKMENQAGLGNTVDTTA
jgi:hypothetical protein